MKMFVTHYNEYTGRLSLLKEGKIYLISIQDKLVTLLQIKNKISYIKYLY